jgi:hypothetical protein
MQDQVTEKLLKLQECDAKCDRIKDQLRRIPIEVKDFENRIGAEDAAMVAAHNAVKLLEVRRRDLETEVGVAEEQANRYKNQQLLVKKNEEYRALTHEISTIADHIGELEDAELELMLEIDQCRENAETADSRHRTDIEDFRRHIELRKAHHLEFESQLADAESDVQEAALEVEEKTRKLYTYVKTVAKRAPYVVAIEDHKCTGCHLRVSTDVEVSAKTIGELARCTHCGRIVYY